jgi:hypothetical protein
MSGTRKPEKRRDRRSQEDVLPVVRWLQAGALAAGVGAAMMAAPAVAQADADRAGGPSSGPGASAAGAGSSAAASPNRASRSAADRARSRSAKASSAATEAAVKAAQSVAAPADRGRDRIKVTPAAVSGRTAATSAAPASEAPSAAVGVSSPSTGASASPLAAVPTATAVSPAQAQATRPVAKLVNNLLNPLRKFRYTFFNTAPTLTPTAYLENLETGVISGNLGAFDANGDIITFQVDVSPLRGILDIAEDGSYIYTPDIEATQLGGFDTFTVRAIDDTLDNPWHVHVINDLVTGLNRFAYSIFGVAPLRDRSVADVTVNVLPVFTQTKPGLIASDSLRVVKTTGEGFLGRGEDEPVMLTMVLQTVAGKKGSTNASLVNYGPGEIGGASAGQTIGIPDSDGDLWIRRVTPLTAADLEKASDTGTAIPIPVVAAVTLMLEGDLSSAEQIGDMGKMLLPIYNKVGLVVESTEFKSLDAANEVKAMLAKIAAEVTPSTADIANYVLTRITQWFRSGGDPDDPVGVGLTALIPVDETVVELLNNLGGPSALGLDSQWMYTSNYPLRNPLWDADIPIRVGFLVPPSVLPDGKVQNWETTYAGDYLDNNWAEWVVKTQAWPTITW